MKQPIDAAVVMNGDWWVACAELRIDAMSVVRPALDEVRVDFGRGTSVGRTIELQLGGFDHGSEVGRVRVRWVAKDHAGLFPTMDAELRVTDVGAGQTELRLVGEYEPPLGAVGAVVDKVAGHRIAERSVRDFLEGLASRLRAKVTAHAESSFWRTRPVDERRADPRAR